MRKAKEEQRQHMAEVRQAKMQRVMSEQQLKERQNQEERDHFVEERW